jgi:hypothetical protein
LLMALRHFMDCHPGPARCSPGQIDSVERLRDHDSGSVNPWPSTRQAR